MAPRLSNLQHPRSSRYGEHDFRAEGPGKPKATAMAEAFAARQLTFEGRGRVFALRPGFRFTLEEHPLDSLDTEYLAVRASHDGCPAAESALVRELLGIPGTSCVRAMQNA